MKPKWLCYCGFATLITSPQVRYGFFLQPEQLLGDLTLKGQIYLLYDSVISFRMTALFGHMVGSSENIYLFPLRMEQITITSSFFFIYFFFYYWNRSGIWMPVNQSALFGLRLILAVCAHQSPRRQVLFMWQHIKSTHSSATSIPSKLRPPRARPLLLWSPGGQPHH